MLSFETVVSFLFQDMAELPDGVKVEIDLKVQLQRNQIFVRLVPTILVLSLVSQSELTFTLVTTLEEVLLQVFEGGLKPTSKL